MKHLLILLFTFSTIASNAQEKERKLSIGLTYSTNLSDEFYITDNPQFDEPVNSLNDKKPFYGFNTGIDINYALFQKFEISLGVQFARYSNLFENLLFFGDEGNAIGEGNVKTTLDYIEVPFRVNYKFLNKKLKAYASLGASFNSYLNNKSKAVYTLYGEDEEIVETETYDLSLQPTNYLGLIGALGIAYSINNRFDIKAEPIVRYALNSKANNLITARLYSFGVQFGLYFKL